VLAPLYSSTSPLYVLKQTDRVADMKHSLSNRVWLGILVAVGVMGLVPCSSPANESSPKDASGTSATETGPWVTSIARVGDDTYVAATADGLLLREAKVCRFEGGHPETLEPIYSHPAGVWAVAVAHHGKFIASSDYRGNLAIHDLQSQETKLHEGVLEKWSQALAISPDDTKIVAGNEAGKLFVVDVVSGKSEKNLELSPSAVAAIDFSPDGTKLAASDGSGTVHLVSWPQFESMGKIKTSEEAVWGVVFVDDATLVVGSSDRNLYRVEAKADAKAQSILTGSDWITRVSKNAIGQIAAAELGGIVHVTTPDGRGSQFSAPSSVWAVNWNANGELFVGTRKNGVVTAVQTWTLEKPKPKEAAKPAAETAQVTAEAKPAEAKPEESKPSDAKPEDAKPAAEKPTEVKTATEKPAEEKPAAEKPADAPAKSDSDAVKPDDAK
jgi:WD40 repeat protein